MAKRRKRTKRYNFRSGFEHTVAKDAEAKGLELEYEPDGLLLEWIPKPKKYKPDFRLPNGIIVETKGRLTVFDRVKMLCVIEQHPDKDIRMVFQYDNRLDRRSQTRYSEWAEKHGIKWAIGTIPKQWWDE